MRNRDEPHRCFRLRGRIGSFRVIAGKNRIGSSVNSDLAIRASGVSRRHATLQYASGRLELEDLGSHNGTFVNGARIELRDVVPGDVLRFGPIELRLEEIDPDDARLALDLEAGGGQAIAPLPTEQSTATLAAPSLADLLAEESIDLVFPEGCVICRSRAMVRLYAAVRSLARSRLPVLIEGETGVGKEAVARLLHLTSHRRDAPFLAVNCAAIPGELLEAEMFGIEDGVATGVRKRSGSFRSAQGGTLFLDEIGEMLFGLQATLLRAIQESEVQPVGGTPTPVDVRIVTATNTDLREKAAKGGFRLDLYYRIAGAILEVPPLRERPDDIPLLVEHFLRQAVSEAGKRILGVTVKTMEALQAHRWPGNVRELEHEVERLACLCPEGEAIESSLLSRPLLEGNHDEGEEDMSPQLADHVRKAERQAIAEALDRTGGSKRKAARVLGISRNTLLRKIRDLEIPT